MAEREIIHLPPGAVAVAQGSRTLRTLLGSCVAIALWDPKNQIGGLTHFLLPSRPLSVQPGELNGRFADEALQLLLGQMRRAGANLSSCQAKLYGGGDMFPASAQPRAMAPIGELNARAAMALLASRRIPVIESDLLGRAPRMIEFDADSGEVWIKNSRPRPAAQAPACPRPASRVRS